MKRYLLYIAIILFSSPSFLPAQVNQNFNVNLFIDYSAAENLIQLCERSTNNARRVAELPGNQIAASTSLLLARKVKSFDQFVNELELLRDHFRSGEDLYGLEETRRNLAAVKILLAELKKRSIDRKIIATIESFFPRTARINASIPVYVVAMGHENAAAFVRRVEWVNDRPTFVGPNEGSPVIVLNLVRMVQYINSVDVQFIETLSTLAHESFHAVFSIYQETSPEWESIHASRHPASALAELVQNEGIAYYISMQQQSMVEHPPSDWFRQTGNAIQALNDVMVEMQAPGLTYERATELMLNANLSGSTEKNYGATAGMRMAYEIDRRLGRAALTETIERGMNDFFVKYREVCTRYDDAPKITDEAVYGVH
ncbi:MAG TPA: DUF5700 domain-containing putative Zn-dependent protease [Bacteroidota bacterium]|nr:DUF5700 domain-containing putative Zn-dependent protease [Bacteroidota bacterium]